MIFARDLISVLIDRNEIGTLDHKNLLRHKSVSIVAYQMEAVRRGRAIVTLVAKDTVNEIPNSGVTSPKPGCVGVPRRRVALIKPSPSIFLPMERRDIGAAISILSRKLFAYCGRLSLHHSDKAINLCTKVSSMSRSRMPKAIWICDITD